MSKSSRICCSVADIASRLLFFELISVLKRLPWESACMLVVSGVAMQSVGDHSSVARVPALGVCHGRLSFVAERHANAYHLEECA